MKYYCKKCFEFEDDEIELKESIRRYIQNIPQEERVKDTVYEKRLQICENCSNMVNGMCRYCGCFVVIRAVKKKLLCPNPESNKWGSENC